MEVCFPLKHQKLQRSGRYWSFRKRFVYRRFIRRNYRFDKQHRCIIRIMLLSKCLRRDIGNSSHLHYYGSRHPSHGFSSSAGDRSCASAFLFTEVQVSIRDLNILAIFLISFHPRSNTLLINNVDLNLHPSDRRVYSSIKYLMSFHYILVIFRMICY